MELPSYLDRVERALHEELDAQAPDGLEESQVLLEASRHLSMAPGAKRARPQLVYHFGRMLEAPIEPLVRVALAGECIHAASLLHDDVVDAGTTRRGRPTVNARWSNAVAVLGGDVLLCISISALHDLPRIITREAVELVSTMSRAAILEVEARGNIDLPLTSWEQIARGKTGVLFGWCGRAPAHLVGSEPEVLERLDTCGRHLGIAFQLADDLKDLTSAHSGKDRFADIRNRNPSYPILHASQASPELCEALRVAWRQPQLSSAQTRELGRRVLETGAADHTRSAIVEHVGVAFDALGPYRETPGGRQVVEWANHLSRIYLTETEVA